MTATAAASSWFDPKSLNSRLDSAWEHREFERLWRAFMTARLTIAVVLLLLQCGLMSLLQTLNVWPLVICSVYCVATLWSRLKASPRRLEQNFDLQWVLVIGVDVLCFIGLHFFPTATPINYSPLLALPVLLASLLGTLKLALGTSAGVTLLVLIHGLWLTLHNQTNITPHLFQSALTGAGMFIIAFLSHQLSARLLGLEQKVRRHQFAARIQQQVNALMIGAMSDGILVVDARGTVHAANPAARQLLQTRGKAVDETSFSLLAEPGWYALVEMTYRVFSDPKGQLQQDIQIQHDGGGVRRLHVRTQLTGIPWGDGDNLSVIFLQDLRELEARIRTEKLASMGRMSAAVAHEIRNPLAAISQANALLEEDLTDPHFKRLTQIIAQNATRLEKIVDDILNLARVGTQAQQQRASTIELTPTVRQICNDWGTQAGSAVVLSLHMTDQPLRVDFESEHLRRVLVNLLDNAKRYATSKPDAIQVQVFPASHDQVLLSVWSDGAPMEPSVEQHLFEPFFSSESRSSGLGLYICRSLCESHHAHINYRRVTQTARGTPTPGNSFDITLRRVPMNATIAP